MSRLNLQKKEDVLYGIWCMRIHSHNKKVNLCRTESYRQNLNPKTTDGINLDKRFLVNDIPKRGKLNISTTQVYELHENRNVELSLTWQKWKTQMVGTKKKDLKTFLKNLCFFFWKIYISTKDIHIVIKYVEFV